MFLADEHRHEHIRLNVTKTLVDSSLGRSKKRSKFVTSAKRNPVL